MSAAVIAFVICVSTAHGAKFIFSCQLRRGWEIAATVEQQQRAIEPRGKSLLGDLTTFVQGIAQMRFAEALFYDFRVLREMYEIVLFSRMTAWPATHFAMKLCFCLFGPFFHSVLF